MNSERIDPEILAAFLDGTLPANERERVLQALAQGGAAYEDLLEAQALASAADTRAATSPAPASAPLESSSPISPPAKPDVTNESRRLRRRAAVFTIGSFLAAASIVGLIVLQRELSGRSPTARTMAQLAMATSGGDPAVVFGDGWDRVNWPITRGPAESIDDRVHAFRLGVRFVDFAVATSSRNPESRHVMGETLAHLAASGETGAVAAHVTAIAEATTKPTASELAGVSGDLRGLVSNPVWYDAAVWSESARLAGRAGNAEFFAAGSGAMRDLRRIVAALDAGTASRAMPNDFVQSLRQLVEKPRLEISTIQPLLDSAVAQGGR